MPAVRTTTLAIGIGIVLWRFGRDTSLEICMEFANTNWPETLKDLLHTYTYEGTSPSLPG